MDEKIFLVLISACVGWLFGQGGELFREWRNNRKLKRSLINELEYIQDYLIELQLTYKASLKIYSQKTIDSSLALSISHPIYSNHYKDICHKLNKYQRQSYDLIHGLVDKINNRINEQTEVVEKLYIEFLEKGDWNKELFNWWGEILASQYCNIMTLEWCVNYHLNNKDKPYWDYESEAHKKLNEIVEDGKNKVDKIILEGKSEDLTNLNKIIVEEGSKLYAKKQK